MAVTCFQYMSCYEFCERISRIQHHKELARLFVLHLRDGHVNLAGVDFTLTPEVIAQATGIPNVGEVWNKRKVLDSVHFEPFVIPTLMRHLTGVFPFRFLRSEYAPMMRLIMLYFTCEGRFSQVYSYHIRLLMHFTQVRMMNIPVFFYQNIERMVSMMQRKSPAQQYRSLYHYGLIQLVVLHQLAQQGISWEEFISRELFTAPSPPHLEVVHEEGGPSQQHDIPVTRHVSSSPVITYQRGQRALFAAARQVLSPQHVEGVSPSSSAQRVLSPHQVEGASLSSAAQVSGRGKQPKIDEGPSSVPDIELIDLDVSSPSRESKEIIQHLRAENDALQRRLEGAQWTISYLEQHNKQLEDEQALDELWRIRSDCNLNRRRPGDPLPAEQDSMLI